MKKPCKCFYCKEEIQEDDVLMMNASKTGKTLNRRFHKSKGCYELYMLPVCACCGEVIKDTPVEFDSSIGGEEARIRTYHASCIPQAEMQRQERIEWDKLYNYVKTNILGYSQEMNLSSYCIQRLKGLRDGEFILGNGRKEQRKAYPYIIIYATFVKMNSNIKYALRSKTFDNESRKIDYIMTIVDRNINDVYLAYKAKKEADKKLQQVAKEVSVTIPVKQEPSNGYIKKGNVNNLVLQKLKHLI